MSRISCSQRIGRTLLATLTFAAAVIAHPERLAGQGPDPNPVRVMNVAYHQGTGIVQFTLLNPTSQTLTAWMVDAYTWTPAGAILPLAGRGSDSYLSAAGLTDRGAHIPPGTSLVQSIAIQAERARTASVVEIRITAALFDDGSAYGEAALIDDFFRGRQRAHDALTEFLGVLNEMIGKAGRTPAALRSVYERLDSRVGAEATNPTRRVLVTNLRLAIEAHESGTDSIDSRIRALEDYAERHLAAVSDALRRK